MVRLMRDAKIDTIKILLEHLEFVPKEGRFIWKDGPRKGKFAGSYIPSGYREIAIVINKRRYREYEHRLVWYLAHGSLPKYINHINEDFADNRLENLKEAFQHVGTNNQPIDEEFLIKYLLTKVEYCFSNNYFIWKENRQKKTKGNRAGGPSRGYWLIKFRFNGTYQQLWEHRLIWYIHHHALPEEIDHINGIRDDNRIENLRSVDRYGNAQNLASHRAGKLWGVSWENNAWRARFRHGSKSCHVGRYPTKFQAYRAVIKKAKELGIPTPDIRKRIRKS